MKKMLFFVLAFILMAICISASEISLLPNLKDVGQKSESAKGIKLWPQITDGIYNEKGDLVMNCVIGDDGFTVTDLCWDTYQVPGLQKRWNIDGGEYQNAPLKDFKFDKAWAGLPVTITVELYNPEILMKSINNFASIRDKCADTVETYQEILILGGKQEIVKFPKWFSIPTDRLAYDFDENPAWPKDWTLPKGKLALFQGCAKVRQKDIDGQNPWLRFGFTHIYPHAITHGGVRPDRDHLGGLFYDNEWIDYENGKYKDGSEPGSWHGEVFLERAKDMSIIMPDFEWCGSWSWQDYQYEAFKKIIDNTREAYPELQIGCWGIGPANRSYRVFDDFDVNTGKELGVVNEEAAMKWRNLYKDPSVKVNPVYSRCNLNFGNCSIYYYNNTKPSQLYAFVQEYENGKQSYPENNNVMSSWIQVEFVDNYPLSTYMFKDSTGKERVAYMKHQVPAAQVYASSLFGHTVMDGLHCWDLGCYYSEDPDDYTCWEKGESIKKISVNGEDDVSCNYYIKYFGFYNYHVLAMWQASQNKDIIEADTPWVMPEYKSSRNNIWREGDDVFPSFAALHKEPLIRVKLSKNGKELLVVADNSFNTELEHVTVRVPGTDKTVKFDLVGDWPQILRFQVK